MFQQLIMDSKNFQIENRLQILSVRPTYKALWLAQVLGLVTAIRMNFPCHQNFCFDFQNLNHHSLALLDERQACFKSSKSESRGKVVSLKDFHCFPTWLIGRKGGE